MKSSELLPLDPPPFVHVVKVLIRRSISSIYIKAVYIFDMEPRKPLSLTRIMLVNNIAEIINPEEMQSKVYFCCIICIIYQYILCLS